LLCCYMPLGLFYINRRSHCHFTMKSLQLHYEVVSMASGLFHVTRMIAAMGAIATSGFTV